VAIRRSNYCVIDTETTGLDGESKAEAIEVACLAIDYRNLKELNRFATLIQPKNIALDQPIPDWAKGAFNVNNIKLSDLQKAPLADEVCHKLIGFFKSLNKPILVGHNIAFDIIFLDRLFKSCGLKLKDYIHYQSIDTCTISHLLWSGDASMPNVKLVTVAQKLGIEFDAHRAMSDVEATAQIFTKFLSFFANSGSKISTGKVATPPPSASGGGNKRKSEFKCPDCQPGYLVMRTASKGRNAGSKFYGCTNFPNCRFACNLNIVQKYKIK